MNTEKISQSLKVFIFSSLISLPSKAQNQQELENLKFTNFTVSCSDKKKIFIDWSMDNSISTNYFEIQKSTDGINFKTIAFVLGPGPKCSDYQYYGSIDKIVRKIAIHSYYRLKHIDNAGLELMSEAKLLNKL